MNRLKGTEHRLIQLRRLADAALADEYRAVVGTPAPRAISRDLLEGAVGYRLQQILIAKLRHQVQRVLSAAEAIAEALPNSVDRTVLIRERRGRCHVVTILESGIEYRGRVNPSLAAVSRVIAGRRVSATEFFGQQVVAEATNARST